MSDPELDIDAAWRSLLVQQDRQMLLMVPSALLEAARRRGITMLHGGRLVASDRAPAARPDDVAFWGRYLDQYFATYGTPGSGSTPVPGCDIPGSSK